MRERRATQPYTKCRQLPKNAHIGVVDGVAATVRPAAAAGEFTGTLQARLRSAFVVGWLDTRLAHCALRTDIEALLH